MIWWPSFTVIQLVYLFMESTAAIFFWPMFAFELILNLEPQGILIMQIVCNKQKSEQHDLHSDRNIISLVYKNYEALCL